MSSIDSPNVAIVFAQYGPYHHARVRAFSESNVGIIPIQVGEASRTYAWDKPADELDGLRSLVAGPEEDASFRQVFVAAWGIWRRFKIGAVFLPSYSPASSLALLLSAKLSGVRCIMMNESHAGTERAQGLKKRLKRLLVSLFQGAIVGGEPHRRYFKSLGMNPEMIVTGYDAIDNSYFANAAADARARQAVYRARLGLPERYLLSLGRMVEKKNLASLVDAYAEVKRRKPYSDLKLVFVGSGECQSELIVRCVKHGLCHSLTPEEDSKPADVLFYGFRQIDENPIFYALSQAFVLPSLYEEWGLVVNEAMACGLPVLVSGTVGSAEDLVVPGLNGFHFRPESSAELAEHILFLEENEGDRRRMGAASSERIQNWGCENFAKNAKQVLDLVMR